MRSIILSLLASKPLLKGHLIMPVIVDLPEDLSRAIAFKDPIQLLQVVFTDTLGFGHDIAVRVTILICILVNQLSLVKNILHSRPGSH